MWTSKDSKVVRRGVDNIVFYKKKIRSEYEILNMHVKARSSDAHAHMPDTSEAACDDPEEHMPSTFGQNYYDLIAQIPATPELVLQVQPISNSGDGDEKRMMVNEQQEEGMVKRNHMKHRARRVKSPYVHCRRSTRPRKDERQILAYLATIGDPGEILVDIESMHVSRVKLSCLLESQMLNSAVVLAFAIGLISSQQMKGEGNVTKHYCPTYVSDAIIHLKRTDLKYMRPFFDADKLGYVIVHCGQIYIPIFTKNHWLLVVLNMRQRRIQALVFEHILCDHGVSIPISQWDVLPIDVPHQENGVDCGVFMLKFMDFWDGSSLTHSFSQANITHIRKELVAQLVLHPANKVRSMVLENALRVY